MKNKYILPFISLIFTVNVALAQEIKPAVQQGHFNDVSAINLNTTEEILTSAGTDGQTIEWDLKTGMQLNRIVTNASSGNLVKEWSGFGQQKSITASLTINDTLYSIEGPLLTISKNGIILTTKTSQYFDKGFSKILTQGNTNYIFASSFDGLIYVYDKKSLKQIKLLKLHQSSVNDIILTKSSKSLFSASSDRTIIEWDLLNLSFKRRFHGYSFRITALAFSLDGTSLYFGNEIGELKNLSLKNYSQSLLNFQVSDHALTDIIPVISKKDSLFRIVSLDNKIKTFEPKEFAFSTFKKYHRISWKQSQQNVLENGMGLYLGPSFEKVMLDYNATQTSFAYCANETKGRLRRKIIFKNTITGKSKTIRSDFSKIDKITVINDSLIAVQKNVGSSAAAVAYANDANLTIWKIKKNKLYNFSTKYKLIKDIESYQSKFLIILKTDSLFVWDLTTNTTMAYSQVLANNIWIKNKYCFVADYANTIFVYTISTNGELLLQGKLSGHEGEISSIDVSSVKNIIATGSSDATIRFWSLDSLNHLGTLIPVSRTDFILLSPTGEYQITKKAFGKFGFSSGTHFIYPAQFDLRYNMPHVVLKSIGIGNEENIHMLENAYEKRLKRMGFEENVWKEQTTLPEIEIVSQFKSTESKIELSLSAFDKVSTLDRINIYVNDVPIYGSKGFSLIEKNILQWDGKINVDLINGRNKIEVSVLNSNGVESIRKTALIDEKEAPKSNLYVVSFGVSIYKDKTHNLTYPHKDAEDLSAQMATDPKNIYENVYTKTLTNEKFTKEALVECKTFLKDAKAQDVVIVFVAGHGVLDKNLDYYLATYDMDFNNPAEKGLPYEELESLLDGIAPLKKVLFLDACHSGEVDKEEVELLATNTSSSGKVKFRTGNTGVQKKNIGLKSASELMGELFTDLRRGTGATVISSAGGVESAMESDEWKNGLFTYCLLHGLKDEKADTNNDGKIMLSELQLYLRKEVTELSNGAQQPTSRIENLSMDFRVW